MIAKHVRVVLDTNVLVSAVLSPSSTAARCFNRALDRAEILYSTSTLHELEDVLWRPKFLSLRSDESAHRVTGLLCQTGDLIEVTDTVTDCRDPSDNKFLALALNGKADLILTGDKDLLALHPWRGIPILTPAAYLALTG